MTVVLFRKRNCTWRWQLYSNAVISVIIPAAAATATATATASLSVFLTDVFIVVLVGCLLLQDRCEAQCRMIYQHVSFSTPVIPQVEWFPVERDAPVLSPENKPSLRKIC
jgi:hypothetical protein